MTWDFHKDAPHAPEMRQLYGADWWDYPEMTAFIRSAGYAGLNNGLTEDENRALARARAPERIVKLLLTGLNKLPSPG
jgi:hypothetical protein